MKILFGLGNPGIEYHATRHNAGFICLDQLRQKLDLPPFALHKKFHAEITEGITSTQEKIMLVKPLTFMNHSGETVRDVIAYYKTSLQDIFVVHDDLDIALGKFKISPCMRAAGHNGVQSIIEKLGTQDFMRIRIGVEAKGGRIDRGMLSGEKFVLQKFSDDELKDLDSVITEVITFICSQL